MSQLSVDPSLPLQIVAQFDTPLRILVDFMYKRPPEHEWRTFYSAKISQEVPDQIVRIALAPMPKATELLLAMVHSGSKHTDFRVRIEFLQDGTPVGEAIKLVGSTGEKLAAYRQAEVLFV